MLNSRKPIITLLMLLFMAPAFAQTKTAPPAKDCFKEWYTLFKDRGGKPVTDGTQDVIITVRGTDKNQCYMGKIDVANGRMTLPLYVQKEDGSFALASSLGKTIDPEFTTATSVEDRLTISDGMSISFRTSDGEYVRLFFYKFLNEKPKAYKVAPSPSQLIKN